MSVSHKGERTRSRSRAQRTFFVVLVWVRVLALTAPAFALDSVSADPSDVSRRREIAALELKQARGAAEEARNAERAARRELDNFVAQHFEEYRSRSVLPPEAREALPEANPRSRPEWVQLNQQLQELLKQRDQLLGRFTAAHPEVADVEQRVAAVSQQLEALGNSGAGAEVVSPGRRAEQSLSPNMPPYSSGENEQHQKVAALYEKVFVRWQSAERNLRKAVAAEDAAAQNLAAFELPEEPRLQPTQGLPQLNAVYDGPQNGSQSLALAALLIALAVAALAAVRLARSDSIFSGVDDVAAALALPVVGVIPASASASSTFQPVAIRPVVRGAVVVGEIVLAFLAFTLIAYGLQNPAAIWQFCTDPLDSFRRAGGDFGGR